MSKILSFIFVVFCSFMLLFNHAEAKRFGGGKSFGMQRTLQHQPRSPLNNLSTHAPASTAKKWLAPLMGLAAGGLLGYLFMSHGLGSGILTWLIIGGLILLIVQFFKRRTQAIVPTSMMQSTHSFPNHVYEQNAARVTPSTFSNAKSFATPINFNQDEFLRDMKAQFIRLQTAYDQANLPDIREFTTPEVFAEVQVQLQERDRNITNKTDILNLNAELIDIAEEFHVPIASVQFTGLLKENDALEASQINEIWHFRRDSISMRWFVAGIQQAEIVQH